MSDDEEGGYNTITHLESGRGVKLLYSKSKVRHHFLLTEEGLYSGRKKGK
jgi:hypothetical protein